MYDNIKNAMPNLLRLSKCKDAVCAALAQHNIDCSSFYDFYKSILKISRSTIAWEELGNGGEPSILSESYLHAFEITLDTKYQTSGTFANDSKLVMFPYYDFSNRTNCEGMFKDCTNLREIAPNITIKGANMLFSGCKNLENINNLILTELSTVSSFAFRAAFLNCNKLIEAKCSTWSGYTRTSLDVMFQNCYELIGENINGKNTIDLSNFTNTSDMKSLSSTFANCYKIQVVKMPGGVGTSYVTNWSNLFQNCYMLEKVDGILDMSSQLGKRASNTEDGLFLNCSELVDVKISGLTRFINLGQSPKLSAESIYYLLQNVGTAIGPSGSDYAYTNNITFNQTAFNKALSDSTYGSLIGSSTSGAWGNAINKGFTISTQ